MSVSRRAVGVAVIGLAIAGLFGLMAWGLLNREARNWNERVHPESASLRPEFTLPLLGGGELVLSQHIGQPVVINFWASWCPPCRREAPALERAWRSYGDRGVLFVGVEIQDTEQDGKTYLEEFDITYPNGLDRDGKITVEYGVIGLPVTFFVNRDGVVERRWVGSIGESRLIAWIDGLVAGVGPSGAAEGENLESFFEFE